MPRADYSGPVSNLLHIGEAKFGVAPSEWINYATEYELGQDDIPDLIKLATDEDIANQESIDDPAVYGPVHAWRALAQLGATEAAEPLLGNFEWDDDYSSEDLAHVYSLLGPSTIPALANHIKTHNTEDTAINAYGAVSALSEIAQEHPEAQAEVIKSLNDQLEQYQENDPALNGILAGNLADLGAKDSLPLIEAVFAADRADIMHTDLDYVHYKFGLLDEEEYKKREEVNNARRLELMPVQLGLPPLSTLAGTDVLDSGHKHTHAVPAISKAKKAKAKTNRKIASESRKKNRKRK